MKPLYLEIAAAGGITFRTGKAYRNQFLGLPYLIDELIVIKISEQRLEQILKKLRIKYTKENGVYVTQQQHIRLVNSLMELGEQRDFSIHCVLYNVLTDTFYDPFSGVHALKTKTISIPKELILDRPSRMLEACRLSGELGFDLAVETWFYLYDNARIIKLLSPGILKEELEKILLLSKPSVVFRQLKETRLLEYILPELHECSNIIQSKRAGVANVFEHIMFALDACPPILDLRLTILFHDIAKPQTMECEPDGTIHFFKHEVVGAQIAKQYMKYWGYPKELISKVTTLVLHHMFDADPKLSDRGVRRLINKVGADNIDDLLKVRIADRSGAPIPANMKKITLLKKKVARILNDNTSNSAVPNMHSAPHKANSRRRKKQNPRR